MKYSDYRPTGFDPAGAFLDDRQDWIVLPVTRTRDSGPLDESNFDAALKIMGGEQEDLVEVHRFDHWGPGWFEIILVHPSLKEKVDEMQRSLEDYPVLDEMDYSQREWDDYEESWNSWGYKDFVRAIREKFPGKRWDRLDDIDNDVLREFYEEHAEMSYFSESDGVCIPIDRAVRNMTQGDVKRFIYKENHKDDVCDRSS